MRTLVLLLDPNALFTRTQVLSRSQLYAQRKSIKFMECGCGLPEKRTSTREAMNRTIVFIDERRYRTLANTRNKYGEPQYVSNKTLYPDTPFTRHLVSSPFSKSPLRSPDTKVPRYRLVPGYISSDTCKREAYPVTKYPVSQCIRSRVNAAWD